MDRTQGLPKLLSTHKEPRTLTPASGPPGWVEPGGGGGVNPVLAQGRYRAHRLRFAAENG